MATPAPRPAAQTDFRRGRLELRTLLAALEQDGLIRGNEAQALAAGAGSDKEHPLETISRQNWKNAAAPGRPLTLESLTEWLAGRCGLAYLRIDPLKLDLKAVTGVTSFAYASRFQFLPLY